MRASISRSAAASRSWLSPSRAGQMSASKVVCGRAVEDRGQSSYQNVADAVRLEANDDRVRL